jgi:hypothetical protein
MRRAIAAIGVTLAIVAFTAIWAGSGSGSSPIQASEPCTPCASDGGTGTELLFTSSEPVGGSDAPTSDPVLAAQLT